MPTPKSVVTMDPNFEKQLRRLKAAAAAAYAGGSTGGQVPNYTPVGWNGDPFDYAGLGVPFSRAAANDGMVKAMADAANPGTTGDVVAGAVMVNELAVMERAFRVRHTLRRCRATAHALGRKRGQGADTGPFVQLGVEYVRGILKQAKTS